LSLDPRGLAEDCRIAAVVITPVRPTEPCAAVLIDGTRLDIYGAHAVFPEPPIGSGAAGPSLSGGTLRMATSYPETRRAFMPPVPDASP
jgi:hypothetical protein